jgi:hypothetical protein
MAGTSKEFLNASKNLSDLTVTASEKAQAAAGFAGTALTSAQAAADGNSNPPDAATVARAVKDAHQAATAAASAATDVATAKQAMAEAAAAAGAPAVPPQVAQVGFVLFYVLFAFLGIMAWVSTSDTITGAVPAIVTALLGLVVNPTSGDGANPGAGANPPNALQKAFSLTQPPWQTLIIVGGISTAVCAAAMIWGHHAAAQGSFEVAAGGLFGLLIDTSQFSPFQGVLKAVAKAMGANLP